MIRRKPAVARRGIEFLLTVTEDFQVDGVQVTRLAALRNSRCAVSKRNTFSPDA
jgi:hypothetical protein